MNILCVGDVVGAPGRRILKAAIPRLRQEHRLQAVIVNAENAASGSGITPALAEEIFKYGVDAITLGDHVWDQKEFPPYLNRGHPIVRPANLHASVPGRGWCTVPTEYAPIHVVSLLGRIFMDPPCDNPFAAIDALLQGPLPRNGIVLVDFHAEATSEKVCMGWYLDGRVAAIVGTHTHVQTSDARVLPKGTAYLTDLGMTGPRDSVIGRDIAPVTRRFVTGMPSRFEVPSTSAVLEGALIDIDHLTGKARAITPLRLLEP
ncbi:MAG: TIGR00282 family metallophosphoesterase [Kiritimatiellaeota bacterium]|nr:TIGR00282 family metallophosphoesterase [Kiritimatiellota bacterium]